MRQRLSERHLLFLGYSMRDWNLRVVMQRLAGDGALANQSWSIQREPASAATAEIELTLWEDRDVELLFVLLDDYADKLKRELDRLTAAA